MAGLNLGELFVRIGAQLKGFDSAMGKVEQRLQKLGERLQRAGTALTIGVTAPLTALAAGALKASIGFETAFASVRKNVDGTEADLERLSRGIQDLSTRIPAATREIAAVASAAGQLGIETENILGFTETMIALGETTNLTAEDAANALARLANITQLPQDQFDRLGSTLLKLGKSSASTEREITDMALRIAGAGQQVGLAESEILALSAALSSVGIEAEAGGTAISRVLIEIAKSVELGGQRLEDFAAVAGMTGEAFSEAFRRTPAETLTAFIEGLGRMESEGRSVIQVLELLEFSNVRIRDALLRSSNAGDLLRRSLEQGRRAWEDNTELTETAQKRYTTTGAQLEILRNKVVLVAKELGDALIPAFRGVMELATSIISGVGDLVRGFGGLDEQLKRLILAFVAMVAALGPALLGLAGITKAVAGLSIALQFLARHPIILLASSLVALGVGLAAFTSGAGQAAAAARDLGAATATAAERLPKLEARLKDVSVAAQRASMELEEAEGRLQATLQNPPRGGAAAALANMHARAKRLREEVARLRGEQSALTEETRQARIDTIWEDWGKAVGRADLRLQATGDEQRFLNDQIGIHERALDDLLPLLGAEDAGIRGLAQSIETYRSRLAALNAERAKRQESPVQGLERVASEAAAAFQGLQARIQGSSLFAQKFGNDLEVTRSQISETENTLRDLFALGHAEGLSGDDILEIEGVRQAIVELDGLKAKLQDLQFTHQDFARTFEETFAELASQLQVTGAEVATLLLDTFNSLAQGIGQAVAQAIFYGQSFKESFVNVLKQIGAQVVSTLIAIGIQELAFLILGIGAAAKRTSAQLASFAALIYASTFLTYTTAAASLGLAGIGLLAAAPGLAAAQAAIAVAGAAGAGAAGAATGAGVVALAGGGIARETIFAAGEAGPEVISPLGELMAMIQDAMRGVLLGPQMSQALATPAGLMTHFRPQSGDVVTIVEVDKKTLTRIVVENMPGVLHRKLGNAFG